MGKPLWIHTPEEEAAYRETRRRCAAMRKTFGRPKGSKNRPPEEIAADPKKKYYVRKSPEEISAIRRAVAQRVKVGRKPGGKNSHVRVDCRFPGEKRTKADLLESSRDIIKRCAQFENKTLVEFLAQTADWLKTSARYRHLFTDPPPADNPFPSQPPAPPAEQASAAASSREAQGMGDVV